MSMEIVPSAGQPLTPLQIERVVPAALQYLLERRYYEDFDICHVRLRQPAWYNVSVDTRFFPLLEIAHGANVEESLHDLNMQNVLSSVRDGSHTLAFLAHGDGRHARLFLGVCRFAMDAAIPADEYVRVLSNSLHGNFPGLVRGQVLDAQAFDRQVHLPLQEASYIAAFTGIPALKHRPDQRFVQGLERLLDGLRGERYTFLVVAEPIVPRVLDETIARLRPLSGEIHAQARQHHTIGRSRGKSESSQQGESAGVTLGTGLHMLLNFSANYVRSRSTAQSTSDSASMSINSEVLDKTALYCEQLLDHYIARLQVGRGLGMWNTGIFLLAEDCNAYLRGQGIVRGLFAGGQGHFEPLRVLDLTPQIGEAQQPLFLFRNPELDTAPDNPHPLGEIYHKLATPLTTEELAVWVNFPRREVPGVRLRPRADFGLNPPAVEDAVELGQVVHQGEPLSDVFGVAPRSLTQHTFITGITGAGKTNTCLVLLRAAHRRGVPFLVIEPAKTEYRALLADRELADLQVFTLGDETTSPFRLNPFEFVRGFNLLTHIDFLKAVFNASFPMYASMPYILEECLLEVYTDRGWNLAASTNRFVDVAHEDYTPYLPTLRDLYEKIEPVVQRKKYAAQLTMDITAALKARLQSLLHGGKGLMLDTPRSLPLEQLLNRPTVLELRHVGDDDEKAFLMALLLVLIYEYSQEQRHGRGLQHLTLIEEAHRLLKNIPPSVSMEAASARGKAVEMFTDILAEVREYGEGFVIVDQIPAKLTPDVVKNTNLKVLHRLVAEDDRCFVGNSMGLNPEQREHVVRLRPGEAVVHCAGLDRPILIQVAAAKDNLKDEFEQLGGVEYMRQRMDEIRRGNADIYRRWPGCATCDAPCTYLSPWNEPDDKARQPWDRFFAGLLYGEAAAGLSTWAQTRDLLQDALRGRYNAANWSEGAFFCHLVQLARAAVADWTRHYGRQGGGPGIGVELQRQTAVLVRDLLAGAGTVELYPLVERLRDTMWEQLAVQPARRRPGCSQCRRPCHFGYLVQERAPARPAVINAAIHAWSSAPSEPGDPSAQQSATPREKWDSLVQRIGELARRTANIPIAAAELPHLGYCYLANHETRRPDVLKRILRGYQRVNRGPHL